jgi:hypothetical protein
METLLSIWWWGFFFGVACGQSVGNIAKRYPNGSVLDASQNPGQ